MDELLKDIRYDLLEILGKGETTISFKLDNEDYTVTITGEHFKALCKTDFPIRVNYLKNRQ